MQGFKIENGDIVIGKKKANTISPNGNQIQLIEDNELMAQKLLVVLGTNTGEWFWNESMGINHHFILGKNVTEDMVRSQIEVGVHQVAPNLYLSSFKLEIDRAASTAAVSFTVAKGGNNLAKIEKIYGNETATDLQGRLNAANARITVYDNALSKLQKRLTKSNA